MSTQAINRSTGGAPDDVVDIPGDSDEDTDSEILFKENRHSITIVKEFGEVIDNGKKQMDFYIKEIKRLTQENEDLMVANKSIDLLKAENVHLTRQVEEFLTKEQEYNKTKMDNLRLTEEIAKLKNQLTEEMTKYKNPVLIDRDNDLIARIRKMEEKQEAAEVDRRRMEANWSRQLQAITAASDKTTKRQTKQQRTNGLQSDARQQKELVRPDRVGASSHNVEFHSERASQGGNQGVVREVVSMAGRGDSFIEVVNKRKLRRRNRKQGRGVKGNKGGDSRFEFLADSHGRGLSKLLSGADVTFKPGARMERVVEGAGREGMSCTVLMGGTNDVSVDGVKKGLVKLKEKLGSNRRVVIIGVPHRHDEVYPNVEKLIQRKNELLKHFCDFYNYKFLSIDDSELYFYGKDGLHFNMTGKRWLAKKIQTAVDFL